MSISLKEKRWLVENYTKSEEPIIIEVANFKQSVYIGNCKDCIFQINSKFNGLNINNCTGVGIVFSTGIATCEIVNCKKLQVQVQEFIPMFQVDKSENITIYFSEDCLAETKVFTSKSSEVKAVLPPATEDGDYIECFIPEMFVSRIQDHALVTQVKDLTE